MPVTIHTFDRIKDRLPPETLQTLRQLIKLHGAERLLAAIHQLAIDSKPQVNSQVYPK
jgi:hypothetical protein